MVGTCAADGYIGPASKAVVMGTVGWYRAETGWAKKKRWVDACMQDLKELGMRGKWKDHCLHRKEWASQIKAKVCLSRKELQSSVAIECSNCRRVFSREGDRKRHRCDSIVRKLQ